jgi:hypothetical protein
VDGILIMCPYRALFGGVEGVGIVSREKTIQVFSHDSKCFKLAAVPAQIVENPPFEQNGFTVRAARLLLQVTYSLSFFKSDGGHQDSLRDRGDRPG